MSTKTEGTPKVKAARTNQRAILATPLKSEAPPERKKGGRKSKLVPIIEELQKAPDEWHIVAKGKAGTIYQTANRLRAKAKELNIKLEVQPAQDEKNPDISNCYAKFIPASK